MARIHLPSRKRACSDRPGAVTMKRFFSDVMSILRLTGLAVLAAVACCDPAAAADLPVKARPLAPADAGRFWAEMEYLAWSVKGDRLPPLVTTSPTGTPLPQAGILGSSSTTVLFGDSSVNDGWRSGGRLRAGYWFDPQHQSGIEASFFGLEHASTGFSAGSAGSSDPGAAIPRPHHRSAKCSADRFSRPGIRRGDRERNLAPLRGRRALPPRHRLLRHALGAPSASVCWSAIGSCTQSDRLDIASQSTALRRRSHSCGNSLCPERLVPRPQQFSRARSRRCRRVFARPVDARMARQGCSRRQLQ